VLIVVAKLMEQKGHVFLLRALPPLLERYPDLHVLLVGDGPLRGALTAMIAGLQGRARVHLAGNRGDVSDLLAASDLFVLPSLWEGLPMALLEAMASGLPAVVTRVSGTAEVVVDGESGLLVPAGDIERLRAAIGMVLGDPDRARRMGRAARERVERSYSARAQAVRHSELYRRATG